MPRGVGAVKATLRKRWRHKAEWGANIQKDLFLKDIKRHRGDESHSCPKANPNTTPRSRVWGDFLGLCSLAV